MKKNRPIMIAKREGDVEPFEAAKPRHCLAAAMKACDRDDRFADPLARAVELHLRDWPGSHPATTDYIFRCLRTALSDTGMECIAQQLVAHRRHRAGQRRNLAVYSTRNPRRGSTAWRKAAVAQTLESRHGVSHSAARILAGEIERRVLGLEYTVVSTTLIAELIRSELHAWGLADVTAEAAPETPRCDPLADRQAHREC